MSFSTLYRLGFYLMLVFATLVLSIDATDSKLAMLYPAVVAAAAVAAFLTVDRHPGMGIAPALGSLMALGATALSALEVYLDPNLLLLALGHWLVYLQLIYMFRIKSVENDWYMFSLGLVQVMVGTVVSQSDSVGSMLFCWAVSALWVLGLFSLQRDALRARSIAGLASAAGPDAEPYPGLLNLAFVLSAVRVTLTTLALGGVIFLAMPRGRSMGQSQRGDTRAQHLTGFDDEVQLGQLGEILENDNVVLSVEFLDENGRRTLPDGEPLWRGVTMAVYEDGRWIRQPRRATTIPAIKPDPLTPVAAGRPSGIVRQMIKLEANDSNALFGFRPMYDASGSRRMTPELNNVDGTLFRSDSRPGSFDYEVRSYRDAQIPQPGERVPPPFRHNSMLGVPDRLAPRLEEIARRVLEKSLPPEKRDDPRAKCAALEAYLRDSGEFAYTLQLDVQDPTIDPVEDFLVNRKEGHCEYFASALALLLRAVKVPTRVVNGFKGGDWNELARVMSVRQKHAHSWVEAYLGVTEGSDPHPIWITLDATPGNERAMSVAKVGGFRANFRQVTDAVRYVWIFYIVGYDSLRQDRLLYAPIRRLILEARHGFQIMGQMLSTAWGRLLRLLAFKDARSFVSGRGFLVAFVGLLLLAGIVRLAYWLIRRWLRWLRGNSEANLALMAGTAHYRRLALLLGEVGLERPPAETQDEFARRATVYLNARGSSTEGVADVPRLVVDAFYRVRFGQRELAPASVETLESRLDALESCLRAPPA